MKTTLILGQKKHSVRFNEGDLSVEFTFGGLIVAELPLPLWKELDEEMREQLAQEWRDGKMTDQVIEDTIADILEEFE